jgi:hypothetical protein
MEIINFLQKYNKRYYEYPYEYVKLIVYASGYLEIVCDWPEPDGREILKSFANDSDFLDFIDVFELWNS